MYRGFWLPNCIFITLLFFGLGLYSKFNPLKYYLLFYMKDFIFFLLICICGHNLVFFLFIYHSLFYFIVVVFFFYDWSQNILLLR